MAPTSYDDPTRTQDPWNSALWADPSTVAAPWGDERPTTPPPPPPAPPAPSRSRWQSPWAAAAIVALAVLVGFGATRVLAGTEPAAVKADPSISSPATPTPSATPTTPAPSPSASDPNALDPNTLIPPGILDPNGSSSQDPSSGTGQTSRTLSPTAAKVAPSIVDITATVGFDGAQAAGTGEILTADGYVLTNHHVVAGSTALTVTVTATGQKYAAEVVGYDASHDIAVIKMRDASGLTPAPFGDSDTVKVGDAVIGLGNAGGVGGTPIEAAGKVTGLDKSITASDASNGTSEELHGLIETDADIKPGDSGGSLIDADGKVIGIITAGSVSGRTGQTTDGYAVPSNQALAIAQDIRDGKASSTIHIGASAFLGVQVGAQTSSNGVRLGGVVSGSAAEKAGLAAGSLITSVDGHSVATPNDLRAALSSHHPGDRVSVSWTDAAGKKHTATVTLGTGPVG